ncbi:MAG: type IV pilus secretin PilQ [Candidatus Binatia bacterium]|nr:type IV pilus secretin PilQ [Candidatus Binatia bacterium]
MMLVSGWVGCISTAGEQKIAAVAEKPAVPARAGDKSPAPAKPQAADSQSPTIQDLSVREEAGQTILQLKLSKPISQYRHFPLTQPSRIVLDIFGDARAMADAKTFRVTTSLVGTVRFSAGEGYLRMTVDISSATVPSYTATPEGGGIKVVVGAADPKITTKRELNLVKGGKRPDAVAAQLKGSPAEGRGPGAAEDESATGEKKYTGQRLSFDFKDADIKNVFRLLAEISGLNIVVTADVNRKVTLRLVDVPWDQALDLLIDTNGLGKEEVGNVVRISTAGQLKAEKDALTATQKAKDNQEPLQNVFFSVNYAKVKDLEPQIKPLLTKRPDATLVMDERSNTIMVRDIRKVIDDITTLVAKLDTRTPQVLIESNLIETTPTFSRSLGIEMEALFSDSVRSSTRFIAGAPFDGGSQPIPTPPTTPLIIPSTGFRFGYLGSKVTSILSAAEAEGNIKVISRPSIVTLNNVESSIEIGEVIRVKKSAATVGESGGIETFRAGIILTVTPQVSADGFVLLKIAVKASEFDFTKTVDGIPRETTREARANVLVRDRETVVIGGIMKDKASESQSGVPYLKEIPVLGWLFKKSSWTKDITELAVFITPRITESGSENLPTAEQLWRSQLKQTEGLAPVNTSIKP